MFWWLVFMGWIVGGVEIAIAVPSDFGLAVVLVCAFGAGGTFSYIADRGRR